jgi:hypothetical protein
MRKCDIAGAVFAIAVLMFLPCVAAWDQLHPERRQPIPGDDPHVFLPVFMLAESGWVVVCVCVCLDGRKEKRRIRARSVAKEIIRLAAQGRDEEVRSLLGEYEKLTGFKVNGGNRSLSR